jgi:hypothetical protein
MSISRINSDLDVLAHKINSLGESMTLPTTHR